MQNRWAEVDVSWVAVAAAFVGAIGTLFLRRLLPEAGRKRGKLPILFLILSVLLRIALVPVEMFAHSGSHVALGVRLAAAIFLTMGLTGVAGMVVFDLFLLRIGIRTIDILRTLILAIAFVIALATILRQSGANLVSLVTSGAVLTAVIGLALQEPIGNMFAGLSMQMDRTIAVGDWVKFEDRIGRVEKISFRATTIYTRDDDTVTVPNRYFMQHEVLNYTRPTERHRMWSDVSFAYQHPPNQVKKVIQDAVAGCPGVLPDPPPTVVVRGFGDHGVAYTLLYFITDFARDVHIESEVKTRIWYAAQRAGLEIPYPLRTVYMHQVTAESRRAGDERDYMERLGALAKIDLFKMLDEADVDLLARGMHKQPFARGETLVRQGDPGDSLFLIAKGQVDVMLEVEGAHRQVATLLPGDILGERSLITGDPRTATCIAHTDVVAHEVPHELFKQLLAQKPTLADDLSAVLSERDTSLDAEREGLSIEARSHRKDETQRKVLARIRGFFHLG